MSSEEKMKLVVYGTLKRGYHNNRNWLSNAKFLKEVTVPGYKLKYSSGTSGFPVAFPSENDSIRGEMFEVSPTDILGTDRLEANGYMYDRTVVHQEEDRFFLYVGNSSFWNRREIEDCPKSDNSFIWI